MARTATINTQLKELIKSGNKIQAIKLYREKYNVGLKEAKDAIDDMAAEKPVKRKLPEKALVAETQQPQDEYFAGVLEVITRNNPRPVHVLGLIKAKRKDETLEQFLTKFFTKWNLDRPTNYKDTGEQQTEPGKRRSLGDIYSICKYYYPNVTLRQVLNVLINVLPTSIKTGFRSSWCTTILKRVWYYSEGDKNEVYNQTQVDEFGNTYKFYVAGLNS